MLGKTVAPYFWVMWYVLYVLIVRCLVVIIIIISERINNRS